MAVLDRSLSAPDLEDLVERIQPHLRRILGRYRIPAQDGEDLVQQTFMALVYNWSKVRSPEPWLLGTLRRHCLMYRREQHRSLLLSVDQSILEWLAAPVDAPQERAGMLRDVERALADLPERCQSILRMRYGLGYDPPEVAEHLGYRLSSMSKVTHRCLEALSRKLATPDLPRLARHLLMP